MTICPQVVSVADPRLFARRKMQEKHQILDENVFDGKRFDLVLSPVTQYPFNCNVTLRSCCIFCRLEIHSKEGQVCRCHIYLYP